MQHFDRKCYDKSVFAHSFESVLRAVESIVSDECPSLIRCTPAHPNTLVATYKLNELVGYIGKKGFKRSDTYETNNIDVVFKNKTGLFEVTHCYPSSLVIH